MKRTRKSAGFSLLELLFVVAILTLVMGAVFRQIISVQKVNRTEDQKMDLVQQGREFVDQFVRDLHQSGFPPMAIYAPGTLASPAANDSRAAVGLVKFAYDEVWFEGDVNGDGSVETIDYKLQPGATGSCPCTVARSELAKANGTAPTAQNISYSMEIQNVVNSGGANGGASGAATYAIDGYTNIGTATQANDTAFAAYKNQNLFTAFDVNGNPVAPADYSTAAGQATLATIKTIRVSVNLLAGYRDMQTGSRAVIPLTAAAAVGNN
jgi:prepilin-type N-terminal cleavage/methylation domain-containing protein